MEALHISSTHGYGDCEDCGMYAYAHASLTFADGTVLHANYDGHLAGGNWSGSISSLYLWALAKYGYQVHLDDNGPTGEAYYVRTATGYDTPNLFDGELQVLRLETESSRTLYDPADPSTAYDYCSAVKVPPVGGAPSVVLRFAPQEEDNITPALRHMLEGLVQLTVEHLQAEDDDFEDSSYGEDES